MSSSRIYSKKLLASIVERNWPLDGTHTQYITDNSSVNWHIAVNQWFSAFSNSKVHHCMSPSIFADHDFWHLIKMDPVLRFKQ